MGYFRLICLVVDVLVLVAVEVTIDLFLGPVVVVFVVAIGYTWTILFFVGLLTAVVLTVPHCS